MYIYERNINEFFYADFHCKSLHTYDSAEPQCYFIANSYVEGASELDVIILCFEGERVVIMLIIILKVYNK